MNVMPEVNSCSQAELSRIKAVQAMIMTGLLPGVFFMSLLCSAAAYSEDIGERAGDKTGVVSASSEALEGAVQTARDSATTEYGGEKGKNLRHGFGAATAEATPRGESSASLSATALPHNLSPWGMFVAADWVVKTVMIILLIASLLTWTILVSKSIELGVLRQQLRSNLNGFNAAQSLVDAADTDTILGVGRKFIAAAEMELQLSIRMANQQGGKEGIKERLVSSLSRIEVACSSDMRIGMGLLATIGAVAPFVGLLGTVWGIMNSFIGISEANTTNLAVVAPGIAEALLATALGLLAAIPAVVIYNHFTRQIVTARVLVSDSAAVVMRLVSRDLDSGANFVTPGHRKEV